MKKIMIFFATYILLSNVPISAGEKYPFYFFRLKPTKMKNLLSREDAQKELCKIAAKNCEIQPDSAYDYPPEARAILSKISTDFELPKDKKLKFAVQKLYKDPDKKSEIVGAFVNAASGLGYCKNFAEHCYVSSLATFVINLKGKKKFLKDYVSLASDLVDLENGASLSSKVGAGEYQSGYYAYMRAMDAIPNDPLSYHAKPTMHWYALANPDESGSKMWFQYKSDLRTPKYSKIQSNDIDNSPLFKRLVQYYGTESAKYDSLICSAYGDKISFVYTLEQPFTKYLELVNKHKMKSLKSLINKEVREICSPGKKEAYAHEAVVPLNEFYENGFFKKGYYVFGIEYTDFVEYQESYPKFGFEGYPVMEKKNEEK